MVSKIFINTDQTVILSVGKINAVLYSIPLQLLLHISGKLASHILNCSFNICLPSEVTKILTAEYKFTPLVLKDNVITDLKRVFIDLSDRCNYNCKSCYHAADMTAKQMSGEVLEAVLRLPITTSTTLAILGGEPLTFPKKSLLHYLAKLAKKFPHVHLYTNGSLLDKEIVAVVKKYGINIFLTFFALNAKEHDEYTGVDGSFNKLFAIAKLFSKNKIKYCIALTLNWKNMNIYNTGKTIFHTDLLLKNNIKLVEIRRPSGNQESKCLIKDRRAWLTDKNKPIQLLTSVEDIMLNLTQHSCYRGLISVATTGELYNCPWTRSECLGNILYCDASTADFTTKLHWRQPLWAAYEQCNHCEFNFLCKDCPHLNNTVAKVLQLEDFSKPYFCCYQPYNGLYESGEPL